MRTDVIYLMALTPTEHVYVLFNENGTYRTFHSSKRAREARPDASIVTMKTVEG